MTDDHAMTEGEYSESDLKRIGERWLEKIAQSEKREDDWIKEAEKAESAYLADKSDADLPSFNILHSNVETIVPSIFNSTPTPDIRPRHNVKDLVGKVVADILERSIQTQVDDNRMDAEVEMSAQDAFMAGRGIVRIKFDADEVPAQIGVMLDPMTGEPVEVEIAPARLTKERVIYENVSWRDYREGPAKRWRDVPWVAYRHEVSEEERERLEDPELAAKQTDRAVDEDKDCTVWEIWDKDTRRVYFVVADTGTVLSITEDPLGLSTFFPQAEPVQPITGTGKRVPVCPYSVYVVLADELNTATKRINAIMKGLKVRGLIAADATDIELLSQAGDNEFVTASNLEGLAATGGLDKAVLWWPVEQAIAVLQQLYVQREQTKQAIYEITGISDIIRGQGAASETATAQQIKTEWGALRVKKMQRLVERQVRDLFVLSAEVISRHFSFETLGQITGMAQEVQAPEVQQLLGKPLDHYRIDVESDSTIRADLTKSRTEMSQFLEGTAQFFSTMAPIVQQSPQAAGPLAKMYSAFARQFNLGKAAEDALDEFTTLAEQGSMQEQGPSPEQQAMQAEIELKQQEVATRMQEAEQKHRLEIEKLQVEVQKAQADLAIKREELSIKRGELEIKEAEAEFNAVATVAEIDIEREQERAAEIGVD